MAENININWQKVPVEKAREILRISEKYIENQNLRLQQAEARALGIAIVTAPYSLAVFGASWILLTGNPPRVILGSILLGVGVALLSSAIISISTVLPGMFYVSGNTPENLLDKNDLEERNFAELIGEYVVFIQGAISNNLNVLQSRADRIRLSIYCIIVGAPLLAILFCFIGWVFWRM
ncbi:MAG: hypothetical protein KDE14_06900 [Rhodobacteraceae bacterium]|nr:hypothetical protein [Paracoccaceae bacterium]